MNCRGTIRFFLNNLQECALGVIEKGSEGGTGRGRHEAVRDR